MLTTLDGPAVIDPKAKYRSKIPIFAPVRGCLWDIAITFGVEKLNGVATRRLKSLRI